MHENNISILELIDFVNECWSVVSVPCQIKSVHLLVIFMLLTLPTSFYFSENYTLWELIALKQGVRWRTLKSRPSAFDPDFFDILRQKRQFFSMFHACSTYWEEQLCRRIYTRKNVEDQTHDPCEIVNAGSLRCLSKGWRIDSLIFRLLSSSGIFLSSNYGPFFFELC